MNTPPKVGECACGQKRFYLRIKRAEQAGLLTCASGHSFLLLDSRDYWMDIIQDGRPKQTKCRCGEMLFQVGFNYQYLAGGDVRTVNVLWRCASCNRELAPLEIDIKYSPTDLLVSRPLDPIDDPWLRPKRVSITAYRVPLDAQRFSAFLVQQLDARIFERHSFTEYVPRAFGEIDFARELKSDLYFTNLPRLIPPAVRNPEKVAPFLRLSSPFHMMFSSLKYPEFGRLHYIEFSEEVLVTMQRTKQQAGFICFAHSARDWLTQNYISKRGRNTADNLEQYEVIFGAKRTR